MPAAKSRPRPHKARAPHRRRRPAGDRAAAAPDPVRLAVVAAFLAFERGDALATEPPPELRDAAARGRYVQLLRGLVRQRRLLAAEVARLGRRPVARVDPVPLALAMLGLLQLRFLDTAPHAALYETVALAGPLRAAHAKGWVNAVLRAAQREGLRDDATAAPLPLAVRTSHPDWLVERWEARYGPERARAVCEANNRYAGAALRVERQRIAPQALVRRLAAEGVEAEPHPLLPGALWVRQLAPVLGSASFREGLCYVQDVTSQVLLAWAAPLLRGRVLDACAAPGGKLTGLLALPMADGGPAAPMDRPRVVGLEPDPVRLRQVRENLARLRLPPVPLLRGDARRLPFRAGVWDAVLLDAPCSATGMIRKYPELKWRKHLADLPRFAAVQAGLLDAAAAAVRPGGHVVYVTCSLEAEENEDAVAGLLARRADFRRVPFTALPAPAGLGAPAAALLTAEGELLLLPGAQQMGLYAALLQRAPEAP